MITVRGLGLDVDSTSSIVAYGLALEPVGEVAPEDELDLMESATIEQMYVVDMTSGRRPMRAGDWKRWRQFLAVLRRSRRIAKRKREQGERLEWDFSRGLEPAL